MEKTYYEILEISITATQDDIKKAYKTLARKYHPDNNIEKDTTKEMQQITEAYLVLSDLNQRIDYDHKLKCQGRYFDQTIKEEKEEVSEEDSSTHSDYQYHSYTKVRQESESDFDESILRYLQKYKKHLYYAKKIFKNELSDEDLLDIDLNFIKQILNNLMVKEFYNTADSFEKEEIIDKPKILQRRR